MFFLKIGILLTTNISLTLCSQVRSTVTIIIYRLSEAIGYLFVFCGLGPNSSSLRLELTFTIFQNIATVL